MARLFLLTLLFVLVSIRARAQDEAEVFTTVERARLVSLMRWSFDGRPRFGKETWIKSAELPVGARLQPLFVAQEKARPGVNELFFLVLALGPFQQIQGDLATGATIVVENERFRLSAALAEERASVTVTRKRRPWSQVRVSLKGPRFEIRTTEGDDRRCLTIDKKKARYTEERNGEARRGWEGETFLELYLDHRAAFEGEVFPAFARFGVPRPVFPWHSKPLAALVRALLPPTLADRDRAFELIAALDAADPRERDRASRILAEQYTWHRAVIFERLRSRQLSPEARFRLRLIEDRFDGGARRRVEQVRAGGLLADPLFRRLLIEAAPGARRRDLARALERLR